MNLSAHFSMEEFTASETAARLGIDNEPPAELYGNIIRTAKVLEQVRLLLGEAITITSGYRCLQLNNALRSKPTSAHVKGLGADIIVPAYGSPLNVCRALEFKLEEFGIDQLIWEFGRWTHIGLSVGAPRHQILTIDNAGTRGGLG